MLFFFPFLFTFHSQVAANPLSPDLLPVSSCVSVSSRYKPFAAQVCGSLGLRSCPIPTGVEFEYRPGILKEAPDPKSCFRSLALLQAAFTCELRHPKDFIVLQRSAKTAAVGICLDLCLLLWKECSPHATSAAAAEPMQQQDAERFCRCAAPPASSVQLRVSVHPTRCLGSSDIFPEKEFNWKKDFNSHLFLVLSFFNFNFRHALRLLLLAAALGALLCCAAALSGFFGKNKKASKFFRKFFGDSQMDFDLELEGL